MGLIEDPGMLYERRTIRDETKIIILLVSFSFIVYTLSMMGRVDGKWWWAVSILRSGRSPSF